MARSDRPIASGTLAPVIGSILGHPVRRVEDPDLLSGRARFIDDLPAGPASLHAAFVRSTFAHGRITGIDIAEAAEMPGVIGVFAAADLGLTPRRALDEIPAAMARPPLADGVVRFVGEPVAEIGRAHV